jgi:hypothetical protein
MNASYSKIIEAIDSLDRAKPFAIWEIRDKSECSTSSVTRVFRVLHTLKYIEHLGHGYLGRHYKTTPRWDNAAGVSKTFELAKIMKMDVV